MTSTAEPAPVVSRRRLIAARALTILAVVLVVVSALANFVKRQALDESQFRHTSRQLIADKTIRDEVAITLVDRLYANVDVSTVIGQRLPRNLRPLSGLIAGAAQDASVRSAQRLLEQPRVQDAFVEASAHAQRQFVAVLDGKTTLLETSGGKVVLDVRPLVLDLGDRFSIVSNLQTRLPQDAGRVTILESDQLQTAQDATRGLRFVADWIWVLALAAAAGAVWLARGRRRNELRALAVGLLFAGFLILIVQSLAGRYVVGHLVASESVRPAAAAAYGIITGLLRGAGWTANIVAVVALAGIWLSGPRPRPTEARHALAPYLRRAEVAYGALVVGYLLLLWWRPTPQFGFPLTVVIWFALALLGLEALRRQTAREFPDAEPKDLSEALGRFVRKLEPRRETVGAAGELERLAELRREGLLDEAEFTRAKASLLGLPTGAP
jgi:hypothetical protein